MSRSTPVTRALDAQGISYRVFQHPAPVESLEQAARERNQSPEQVVRSIVFRLSQDEYVMVLMAGAAQVSWSALRKYLGVSRITMANADEIRAVTGYAIGAVSPFGLPLASRRAPRASNSERDDLRPLRVLADPGVFAPEEISVGSGARGTTVIMTRAEFQRALGDIEIVALSEK